MVRGPERLWTDSESVELHQRHSCDTSCDDGHQRDEDEDVVQDTLVMDIEFHGVHGKANREHVKEGKTQDDKHHDQLIGYKT